MDNATIAQIVSEITPLLLGRAPGKVFQFNTTSFAIDFGLRREGYLLLSVDPAFPRIHLIKRRVRDLERQATPLNQFGLILRKELAHTRLISLKKDPTDRLVHFEFAGEDEMGNQKRRQLIAQLTGRSANLLLLDKDRRIIQTARATNVAGQHISEIYSAPASAQSPREKKHSKLSQLIESGSFSSASEAADNHFASLRADEEARTRAASARAELRKKIVQQEKLLKKLEGDLFEHGDFEDQKRIGDLLLANLSTAKRVGRRVTLVDYFTGAASSIEVEVDETTSLQQEAARRFALYQRSKRAIEQISKRLEIVRNQIHELKSQAERIDSSAPDVNASSRSLVDRSLSPSPAKQKLNRILGTRRYISSDGFEILVGRAASDNDHLTFKVAKPNDLWLHAADYGGSHVVVRNSTRKPVPHRTLIEAAQLAAYFSQAKKDPKVDVHYTERKFVSKSKGAKPGLVRLQRFKNITVKPGEPLARA